MNARILFLVNPGRQSRNYIIGLSRAADRLGIPHFNLELAPLWARLNSAPDRRAAGAEIQAAVAGLARDFRPTHALGYAFTPVNDLGLVPTGDGARPLLAALGVRHMMLWTDHPSWCTNGCALEPSFSRVLADPGHTHFLKSAAAAREAAEILGWPNIHALDMAEDFEMLRPVQREPVHDVVAIIGSTSPVPDPLLPFLVEEDPDPAAMDAVMRPAALAKFRKTVLARPDGADMLAPCTRLAEEWLDLKAARPLDSLWRLAGELRAAGSADACQPLPGPPPEGESAGVLRFLKSDARLWYAATAGLRRMVEWRRAFMLAWLARRIDVGLYGASAAALGVAQPSGAERWVEYADQPEVYARGRVALNINGAPDEEGCTHKPFQIAASRIACVHHESRGLNDLFEPDREIVTFSRPRELLEGVRAVLGDTTRRMRIAESMHERGVRQHTWVSRLTSMLERAGGI